MDKNILKERTKTFGLRIIKMSESLPKNTAGYIIAKQILRSGTSVGANYRSACRGRSKAEFIAKLGISLEEVDETAYWLELIMDGDFLPKNKVESLHNEAEELVAIFSSSIKTSKS